MIARYAALILASPFLLGLSARAQDHLEPEQGTLNQREFLRNYDQRLREVLLKDPGDWHVARMVCLPSFQPEWVVTVVREKTPDDDAPRTYHVEYVVADRKLFPPKDSEGVGAKTSRAPIDRETAEAVNRIWRRMLRMTRYPDEPGLGADGTDYHFSRFLPLVNDGRPDPPGGWEQGTIWSPDEDSPCGRLVAIGERLRDYATAKPEDRAKLGREIREMAASLQAMLDRAGSKK
jgi:hypothetical protein